jgi:hypothetical protein
MYLDFLRDEYGDVATSPDDFFDQYGVPATEWIAAKPKGFPFESEDPTELGWMLLDSIHHRSHLFMRARELYLKESGQANFKALRVVPYVIENYPVVNDGCGGGVETWFFFKENNNGTTYRILAKDQ